MTTEHSLEHVNEHGPYLALDREHWAELAASRGEELEDETLAQLRGIDDPTDFAEVSEVYWPLTELVLLYYERTAELFTESHRFLGLAGHRTPFIIAVAGSVAVGKSTVSRLLRELLSRSETRPKVELITTDGFLYPNAKLESMGLMGRKGFPESYDRRALLDFVMDVKSGKEEVTAPVYSHLSYDIVPGGRVVISQPDILIVEGLNVLQPARRRADGTTGLALSDFFDFSVYVDADDADIREWYIARFLTLRETAFQDPNSYFTRYAGLSEAQARATAGDIWDAVNGPNLTLNVKPTRGRATVILRKSAAHKVNWVRIRKI
ncbi:MAG: type I pantothenate kinase [Propionibacteriaceae bacterium]|jgi:type I pantothenate kinase|nr:type I pantothenate kinase [Propionibacteriaceae bacterium]